MSKFLKNLFTDREDNKIFFPIIRSNRRKSIEIRRSSYNWGAPDYKLYPSKISSWGICPHNHVKNLMVPDVIDHLDSIYKVRRGSAVHLELQQDLIESGKSYRDPLNLSPEALKKLEENRPEIPFFDPESGMSGRLDGCISLRGAPLPVEIKTTSIPIDTWEKHKNSQLPKDQHVIQGAFYCYFPNKLGYYPVKIKQFLLCYLNLLCMPGDLKAEIEFLKEYDSTLEDKTHLLVTHLTKARRAFIDQDPEFECSYPLCSKHGKKS